MMLRHYSLGVSPIEHISAFFPRKHAWDWLTCLKEMKLHYKKLKTV